jgi:hypothetical protein
LNILSVASLPPHPGGSAVSCALLLSGFADAGHVAVGIDDQDYGLWSAVEWFIQGPQLAGSDLARDCGRR